MRVGEAIRELENAIPDPRAGVPEEVFLFLSRVMPLVNVDLLIKDDLGRTLLTWREDPFYGAGWHIPGGIIRYKERASARIEACAREELGVEVDFDAAPLIIFESIEHGQRDRAHFMSMLYRCRLKTALDEKLRAVDGDPHPGQWRWFEDCPENLLPIQRPYRCFFDDTKNQAASG